MIGARGAPFLALVRSSAEPYFKSPVLTFRQKIQAKLPRFPGPITSYHARIFWDSIVLPIEFPELVSISINLLMLSSPIWSIHIIHYRVPTLNITLDTIAYSHIKLLITYYLTSEFGVHTNGLVHGLRTCCVAVITDLQLFMKKKKEIDRALCGNTTGDVFN